MKIRTESYTIEYNVKTSRWELARGKATEELVSRIQTMWEMLPPIMVHRYNSMLLQRGTMLAEVLGGEVYDVADVVKELPWRRF
jgi:hypothetical protein